MSRHFYEMIFLGNGEKSEKYIDKLRKRFDDAISWLGGLQQGEYSLDDEQFENDVDELLDCVEDIKIGLGVIDFRYAKSVRKVQRMIKQNLIDSFGRMNEVPE